MRELWFIETLRVVSCEFVDRSCSQKQDTIHETTRNIMNRSLLTDRRASFESTKSFLPKLPLPEPVASYG